MQLTQAVRRAVQINGRGTAAILPGGRLSWSAFADRVARLAAGLRAHGIAPGDRVGILALNDHRYLEFFFGAAWAGAVFVPVNARLSIAEMAFWLNDSGARALFVDDALLGAATALRPQLSAVSTFVHIGDGAAPAGMLAYESLIAAHAPAEDAGRGGDDLAGIFYTSGTTGRSKGVMLSHANLVANALNVQPVFRFDETTNWLHAAPMFHIGDGTATLAVTMAGGAHSFIPRFDPTAFLESVARDRGTDALCVPTMVNMLLSHPELGRYDISSLRAILYGAAPMPEALIRRAMEALPRVRFVQAYGQTEAAPALTLLPAEYHVLEGPMAGKITAAGRGVFGCEIAILDEQDRELPRGEVGEICARGPNVMPGYWQQPELTAAALRSGWLHTGDGGWMDEDGFVYVVDRLKDMIITGGENVYSAEVEAVLYRHPAVLECAVIGVPDDDWGERVHAVVRLKPGAEADAAALDAHCRTAIAGFKCPRSYEFRDEPLPLSGANKILKNELRKPYWEGRARQVS